MIKENISVIVRDLKESTSLSIIFPVQTNTLGVDILKEKIYSPLFYRNIKKG